MISAETKEAQNRILNEAMPLPDPEPLDPIVAPPPFPIAAFPDFIADYCLGLAHQLQTPPDMPAVACLGVLAAAAGGRVEIEARPGWREPLNAYFMAFADPASRKTAAVKAPLTPLVHAEKRLKDAAKPKHTEAKARREIADKLADKAITAASTTTNQTKRVELEQEAIEARLRADAIVVPSLPQILSEDSTPEAVVGVMVNNGGRAAAIAAETDALDTMMGRYSKSSNMGILLKAHSGESHRTNRRGRAAEELDRMNLTLMLMGQPAVLEKMVNNAEFAGRGFLARLLISVPDETVGYRTPGTPAVDKEVAAEYARRIEELTIDLAGLRVSEDSWGTTETLVNVGNEPALLRLTDEADNLLLCIETEIEPQLREDGRLGGITGWGGKLAGATLRVAGLLHITERKIDEPVSAETLERAWRIGSYFAEHALIAFRQVGITGETDAHKVLDYLRKQKLKEFTVRDLHNALKGSKKFRKAVSVLKAVEVLEDKGWVVRKYTPEKTGPGRKPSPAFESHPSILADAEPGAA